MSDTQVRRFVLDLWPDLDDTDPQALLRFALETIRDNPGLVWDIVDDEGTVLYEGTVLHANVSLDREEGSEFLILTDEDGDLYTECPKCGARDTIVEVDTAVRWNRLGELERNAELDWVFTHVATGDYDSGSDGFLCTQCMTRLSQPDNFEITDWL